MLVIKIISNRHHIFYITITIDSSKDKIENQLQTYIIIAKLYCFINVLG